AGKTIAFRKQSFNDYGGELQRVADEHGIHVTIRYYASFDEAARALAGGEAAALGGNFVDLDAYRATHAGFVVNDQLPEDRAGGGGAGAAATCSSGSPSRATTGSAGAS